jgi:serine phosphatase RsbU (regulator of sigma subunit)/Tfp pilus assembly protein PilF
MEGIAKVLGNIGLVYEHKGDYVKAFEYQYKSLAIHEKEKNYYGLATVYNNIGNLFYSQENYQKALEFHNKSLKLKESLNDKEGIVTSLNNIGTIYDALKKLDTAISIHERALKIEIEIDDKFGMAYSYNNIGGLFEQKKLRERALAFYLKSLAIRKEIKDNDGIASCYLNIGILNEKFKKYNEAYEYLFKALELARQMGKKSLLKDIYINLSLTYYEQNNYKEAYKYHELYSQTKDSLFNMDANQQVSDIRFQYEFDKKESIAKLEQDKRDLVYEQEKRQRETIIYSVSAGLALLCLLTVFIYRGYRTKQKSNVQLESMNKIIINKNKDITDSINYAKRIQNTLLAHAEYLKKHLPEHFVLFNPKDIVSGDFYWATASKNVKDLFYLAVCDSTGHGVPGAFMSLLNISFLNEAINEKGISEPGEILNYVRKRLIKNISQDGSQDGMDGIVLCINKNTGEMSYSAANCNPVLVSNRTLTELNCDRMPVGKSDKEDSFKTYTIPAKKGDMLYLYTDGYADQFGGPKGKKFKYKALNEFLLKISLEKNETQGELLAVEFDKWKGELEQVDDICVIGIKIN